MRGMKQADTAAMPRRHWSVAAISGVAAFHFLALLAFLTGVSPVAVAVCAAMGALRALGITMGYHRYFTHRSFRTGRVFQFLLALAGTTAGQGSIRWWVSHHRDHHKYSDTVRDEHSPVAHGFFHSHIGWLFTRESLACGAAPTPDIDRYPELVWLDRYYWVVMIAQGTALFALGAALQALAPGLGTNGPQMLVWGFFVSTVLLLHVTFAVNSVCHRWGTRPYETNDQSRNNFIVGVLAMGEGWHNNHHRFASSARHGLRWWQIDITYILLRVLSAFGIVRDLRLPSAAGHAS